MIEDRNKVMTTNRSVVSNHTSTSISTAVNEHNLSDINPPSVSEEARATFDEIFSSNNSSSVDESSFLFGYELFSAIKTNTSSEVGGQNQRVYTRVIKDIFHLMDIIKPYKRHGLYEEFTRRFSDSLFTIDENDERKVKDALERNGESWATKMKYDRNWIWKRVKRNVASPNILLPTLKALFLCFGPLKCSKSGRTLFDKVAWKQAASVLKTVQLGHASDPPGVQLYYKLGKKDHYGLDLYRCIRGTNSLEGGVHQNLIRKFGSFGAGPELADAMLAEYRLRHNFDVGTMNRLGH